MTTLTHEEAVKRELQITPEGVFQELSTEQLHEMEAFGIHLEYVNELVAADGAELGYFFYIISGEFEVSKIEPETRKKHVLARIGAGQSFGEMGFLTGAPASANVMAAGTTVCWAIQHDALRRFIDSGPGGTRLAMNIALLLARRVQDGNTRLLGLSSSLSAYFGQQERAAQRRAVEAPRSSDHAEMEIPDEVFDAFARQTLALPADQPLTEDQQAEVRSRIEKGQVDIVPWLERGGTGRPLSVRLKFVESVAPVPRVAVRKPVVAGASAPSRAQPMVVRVPQVRARIAAARPMVVRPRSLGWKIGNIASWVSLPVLTVFVVCLYLPLDARESVFLSPGLQRLPLQGLIEWFLFQTNTQGTSVQLQKGTWYSAKIEAPKSMRFSGELRLAGKLTQACAVTVTITKKNAADPVHQQTIELTPGATVHTLFSVRLEPASYQVQCASTDGPSSGSVRATMSISARY